MAIPAHHRFTFEEYLSLEETSTVRHEILLIAHEERRIELWHRG